MTLIICGAVWGAIRQQDHIIPRLKPENKINTTKIPSTEHPIDNAEIKWNVISGKKFIPYEYKKSKESAPVQVDDVTIQTNYDISDTSIKNYRLNNRELSHTITEENDQKKKFVSPNTMWNARKFIIISADKKHYAVNDIQDNKNESEQQNINDPTVKPDIVHCPSVEQIKQSAQTINEADFYHSTYGVYSHDPAFQESNLIWLVGVTGIVAGSSDEAIYLARINISNTNICKYEYTKKLDQSVFDTGGLFDIFVCYYGPSDIMAVGVTDKVLIDE